MNKNQDVISMNFEVCHEDEFCQSLMSDKVELTELAGIGGLVKMLNEDGSVSLYIDCPAFESKLKITASASVS